METYASALSPSTPFLKTHALINRNHKTNNYFLPNSLRSLLLHSCHKHTLFSFSSSTSSSFSNRENSSFLLPNHFKVNSASASVPENSEAGTGAKQRDWIRTLQLGAMFGIWYCLNIYFNIYNKQVLKVFPFPVTLTAFQFGCGMVLIFIMWGLNLHPRPKLSRSQVAPILTLALIHTIGNVLTNISLGKVAVSFTHTIKAMEPFFTVLFSVLFLAERPAFWVVASLVPIVGGVALASFTEASFNWMGFSSAMASNFTNQSRNVLSKKFMIRKEERLDNINLFSIITIISFGLLVPTAILMEGIKFTPSYLQHYTVRTFYIRSKRIQEFDTIMIWYILIQARQGLNLRDLCLKIVLSGVCFHSYQQISYMILQMVSAVTHAVGNCVKRVVVILSSVIFFQTPVSPINSLGTGLALAGVFLYSRAKQIKPKPKVA